jgi:hypothetical protein
MVNAIGISSIYKLIYLTTIAYLYIYGGEAKSKKMGGDPSRQNSVLKSFFFEPSLSPPPKKKEEERQKRASRIIQENSCVAETPRLLHICSSEETKGKIIVLNLIASTFPSQFN